MLSYHQKKRIQEALESKTISVWDLIHKLRGCSKYSFVGDIKDLVRAARKDKKVNSLLIELKCELQKQMRVPNTLSSARFQLEEILEAEKNLPSDAEGLVVTVNVIRDRKKDEK